MRWAGWHGPFVSEEKLQGQQMRIIIIQIRMVGSDG